MYDMKCLNDTNADYSSHDLDDFVKLFFTSSSDSSPQRPTNITSGYMLEQYILTKHLFDWFQYQHLVKKGWEQIGVFHLHPYGLPLSIWFGINNARYTHTSQCLQLGTYSFTKKFISNFQPILSLSLAYISTTIQYFQNPTNNQECNLLLLSSISEHSLQNLIHAMCSPKYDLIVPLPAEISISPSFLHCLFTLFYAFHIDMSLFIRKLCTYTVQKNVTSSNQIEWLGNNVDNTSLLWIELQQYIYAQPSPIIANDKMDNKKNDIIEKNDNNNNNHLSNSDIGSFPQNFLINAMLSDGSSSVMRVNNGLV